MKNWKNSEGEQGLENRNAAIVLRLEGAPAEIIKVEKGVDRFSTNLKTKWGLSELKWMNGDAYAFIEMPEGRSLWVFSPDGRGFCIDPEGREKWLKWR